MPYLKARVSARLIVLLIASGVLAQNGKPATHGANPDEAAIHDYILTMDKVKQYAEVSRKAEAAAANDPQWPRR